MEKEFRITNTRIKKSFKNEPKSNSNRMVKRKNKN